MGLGHDVSKTRGLGEAQLGGVIFGATKTTIDECLSEQLFGLPKSHFRYVKYIKPGLPLFLFNYTDRTLHGIFEAASLGEMDINKYAWISKGSQTTKFPAQVRIRVKLHGKVLTEKQFKPMIVDNYYSNHHFWFELDHAQTSKLMFSMETQPVSGPRARGIKDTTTCKTAYTKELITTRIEELAQKRNLVASGPPSSACEHESAVMMNNATVEKKKEITHLVMAQLFGKNKELTTCKAALSDKIIYLEQKIDLIEQNLAEAKAEIQNLKGTCNTIEVQTCVGHQEFDDIKGNKGISDSLPDDSILLIGGYDGVSWLSSLDRYSPSQNLTKFLSPMPTERCYAAVSKLDGELFVFGGATRGQRLDTVESFDPVKNQWTFCPPLNQKNENLAGATVKDKIYALGGGENGVDSYSSVEMLDFDVGAWIPTRSMLNKRFALAAAELHGALYAVGGFDGSNYLSSAERYDPRERSWKKIESMTTARGCPSMVVLNEKLFVLGGYDGNAMVSTVEIYDPRRGSWMTGEPMKHPRGFSAAAVAKDRVYIFGGFRSHGTFNETVECYKEGQGWEVTSGACKRCFFSAITV